MYVYVHVKKSSVRARVRMPTCCDVWRRRVRIFGYYLSLVSSQFGVSVCVYAKNSSNICAPPRRVI